MIGIVGDNGAGKTTLTRGVSRILGGNGVTPICLDDYHRYSRAERAVRGLSAADPAANNLAMMAEHLAILRAGGTVQKPVYDHRSGELRGPESVAATGLVIAYGMFTLTPPSLADLFDLTVYVDPDAALRHHWRLGRDTSERGYAAEQVLALRPTNDDAAQRYVAGQRRYAGLVVRFRAPSGRGGIAGDTPLGVELLLRRTPAAAPLGPFLAFVAGAGLPGIAAERAIVDEDGRDSDRLSIAASLGQADYEALLGKLWPPAPGAPPLPLDRLGTITGAPPSRTLALVQVLIASFLAQSGLRREA